LFGGAYSQSDSEKNVSYRRLPAYNLVRSKTKKKKASARESEAKVVWGRHNTKALTAQFNPVTRTASQANGLVGLWLKYASEVFVCCLVDSNAERQPAVYYCRLCY
jgi:hypothetical protein